MGKNFVRGLLASLLALAVLAPSALADTRFSVWFSNDITDGTHSGYAGVYDSDRVMQDGYTLDVVRAGSVVATATGDGYGPPFATVPSLTAGDQLHLTGNGEDRTWTYDGLPSFDLAAACVGSSAFGGGINAAVPNEGSETGFFYAGVYGAGGGSGWGEPILDTSKVNGDGTYKITTTRALAAGDHLSVMGGWVDGDTRYSSDASRTADACVTPAPPAAGAPAPAPAPAAAPAPAPKLNITAPPTAAQVLARLLADLGTQADRLSHMDLGAVSGRGSVNVPFTFLVAGKVRYVWSIANGAAVRSSVARKRSKKAAPITVATGAKALPAPGVAKVKLKLTKAGRKLLRKAKSARITFNVEFTPAAGGPVQKTSTRFTLKKAKKAKKAKKHAKRS